MANISWLFILPMLQNNVQVHLIEFCGRISPQFDKKFDLLSLCDDFQLLEEIHHQCIRAGGAKANLNTLLDKNSSDKIVEILTWCRKFCPTKNFVQYFKTKVGEKSDKIVEILT